MLSIPSQMVQTVYSLVIELYFQYSLKSSSKFEDHGGASEATEEQVKRLKLWSIAV
jgi:hypothetical protein